AECQSRKRLFLFGLSSLLVCRSRKLSNSRGDRRQETRIGIVSAFSERQTNTPRDRRMALRSALVRNGCSRNVLSELPYGRTTSISFGVVCTGLNVAGSENSM